MQRSYVSDKLTMRYLTPVLSSLFISGVALAADAPRERAFHFEYSATVKEIPRGAAKVDLWIPVPQDSSFQRITKLSVETPYPYEIAAGPEGNSMLHLEVKNPAEFSVKLSFDSVRKEHVQTLLASTSPMKEESRAELARYLKPDRLVPLDDTIRKWAMEVVTAANAKTDVEMARAIYNHIVATVKYDKTGKGWGNGDIYYACDARRGNCTDFHAIFIGYARAMGIPARFAIGFPLPASRGEGKISGYHCWAEFYAAGIGWVPVDASEAAKDPSKREYFFGAHDENRVEFSRGRDVVLTPKQHGDPLNYFVYPHVEADGKKVDAIETVYSYRDLPAAVSASIAH
jgi:transglutaminase-like putative cysteine protease